MWRAAATALAPWRRAIAAVREVARLAAGQGAAQARVRNAEVDDTVAVNSSGVPEGTSAEIDASVVGLGTRNPPVVRFGAQAFKGGDREAGGVKGGGSTAGGACTVSRSDPIQPGTGVPGERRQKSMRL